MWIPIVLVIWSGVPEWHILPPPVTPYPDRRETCYQSIETAKAIIMSHPKYQRGNASLCQDDLPRKYLKELGQTLKEAKDEAVVVIN